MVKVEIEALETQGSELIHFSDRGDYFLTHHDGERDPECGEFFQERELFLKSSKNRSARAMVGIQMNFHACGAPTNSGFRELDIVLRQGNQDRKDFGFLNQSGESHRNLVLLFGTLMMGQNEDRGRLRRHFFDFHFKDAGAVGGAVEAREVDHPVAD